MTSQQKIEQSVTKKLTLGLVKVSISVLICYVVFTQIEGSFSSIEMRKVILKSFNERFYLVPLMLFMSFLNWSLEALKWIIVLPKRSRLTFSHSFQSVLTGMGMSVLMPRLAGESMGRYTSHKGDKKDVFSGLVITKIIQTLVTFSFGIIGVLYYKADVLSWFSLPNEGLLITILLLFIGLAFLRNKIWIFVLNSPYLESVRQVSITKCFKLILVSILRYVTFFGQFFVISRFIGLEVGVLDSFFALATLFLLRMSTISVNVVVDLGLRFATALLVFSKLDVIEDPNLVIVIFSLVWLFNVILPSLSGGVLIWKKR